MSIRAGVIPRLRLLSLAPSRSKELGLELLEPENASMVPRFRNLKPCWLPPRGFASTLGSRVAVWPETPLDVRWCRPASCIGSGRR